MNSEEDEFKRIEAEAKRRTVEEDDDTQTYTSETAEEYLYRFGYENGVVAEREACARLCDRLAGEVQNQNFVAVDNRKICAKAIRARSNT